MFESNFPVDRECISYRTLWNMFKRIAAKAGLSEDEKASVFSGTAARVYRLQD
jgi:predicted TIM-barrel fold metal-dependent hydrolase